MSDRFAVMDLGTNTFHLLIAEAIDTGFKEILHEEAPVKLGEGGINNGLIQPAPFERGIQAMEKFHELIVKHKVQMIKAIATSALRNAANGKNFIDKVSSKTGVTIEIIDGDTEAGYIYEGVKAGGGLSNKNSLIIDIGGGSCEFIICNKQQMFWKKSFEVGAARLMDKFHQIDPIPHESVIILNVYLDNNLRELFTAALKYPVDNIVGSSGVFESYASIIEVQKGNSFDLGKLKAYTFGTFELTNLLTEFVRSSHKERENNREIITVRVDMIVVASVLLQFILANLSVNEVVMSTYSLREGVLAEMVDK